ATTDSLLTSRVIALTLKSLESAASFNTARMTELPLLPDAPKTASILDMAMIC
ncbi:hypothetical protein LTR56_027681, partial [Elasticomyces elasticus]